MSASTIPAAAAEYRARGWTPIPLAGKNPAVNGKDWQKREYDDVDFERPGLNVGVFLGERSAGLVDNDLDCPEACKVAKFFLPGTQAVFGRDQVGPSHLLYVTDKRLPLVRLRDPINKDPLCEFRDGDLEAECQTMFPPSVHPDTKETVHWYRDGEPAKVDARGLFERFKRLAAAALLVRYWPEEGSRHEAHDALSGGLTRMGWEEDEIRTFVDSISFATGDDEGRDRQRAAASTVTRTHAGQKTTGWPTLARLLKNDGKKIVATVCDWLGSLAARNETKKSKPDGSSEENAENHAADSAGGEEFNESPMAHPAESPIDGVQLLNDIEAYYRKYVRLQEAAYAILPPWNLHTHAFKAFSRTLYVHVTSPTVICGKTTLLEITELIVPNPLQTAGLSEAVLARVIEKEHPVLLLDELDELQKGNKELLAAIMATINSGYKKSGCRVVLVQKRNEWEPKRLSTFCAKMLASIGKLPSAAAAQSRSE